MATISSLARAVLPAQLPRATLSTSRALARRARPQLRGARLLCTPSTEAAPAAAAPAEEAGAPVPLALRCAPFLPLRR